MRVWALRRGRRSGDPPAEEELFRTHESLSAAVLAHAYACACVRARVRARARVFVCVCVCTLHPNTLNSI